SAASSTCASASRCSRGTRRSRPNGKFRAERSLRRHDRPLACPCYAGQSRGDAEVRELRVVFVILLALAVGNVVAAGTAFAQADEEVEGLNRQAAQLYQTRKYDEAMPIAEKALALGEQRFGPDDARLGELLNNVALIH